MTVSLELGVRQETRGSSCIAKERALQRRYRSHETREGMEYLASIAP